MTATLTLRDYQRECVDALFRSWTDGTRRPAVVLPTGAGKTVIFSALINQWRTGPESIGAAGLARIGSGPRVIVLVHRDELADQAIAKIRAAAPGLVVGKVKASINDVTADVMVCSVQTLAVTARRTVLKAREAKHGRVGLIITDECHHAAAVSYQKIYEIFPDALHAGFTATLERGDGVGLGSVWDDVVYSRSPLWMMKHGYLVQPRAFTETSAALDLKGVKKSRGDYQSGDLGRAIEESDLALSLPAVWKEHAADRATVVFTPTVATAHGVADAFTASGIRAGVVSGETPREERQRIYDDFRRGEIKILSNCMVLTEGFDAPWASCAIIARPTQSRPLYIQMVGRVLRPWHGKTDAIVINVAGAGGKISTLVDLQPGSVMEVKEGEGLLEAEEREAREEAETQATVKVAQTIRLKEASSLFAASHAAWQTTAGGVMFIGAGEWTYFLWANRERPGSWDVCRKPKYGAWERTQHVALDVEMAMSWAEAEAEEHGSFNVFRKASWRRSAKPSEAQLNYAAGLGIATEGLGKSELSDMISYVLESRALDPFIGLV